MKKDDFFPQTPWNICIGEINKQIINLDNDRPTQHEFIRESYHKLLDRCLEDPTNFKLQNISAWYDSQCQLCGVLDFSRLYDTYAENKISQIYFRNLKQA